MRCLACNSNLTDAEASLKYLDWQQIKVTEDRYPMLCIPCLRGTDLMVEGNPLASEQQYQDEKESVEEADSDE